MDAGTLYTAIAEVCPVLSTKVESATDRATWSYEPKPEATQPQKDAANNVLATIPVDQFTPQTSPPRDALYDHENRILALEGLPPTTLSAYMAKTKLG